VRRVIMGISADHSRRGVKSVMDARATFYIRGTTFSRLNRFLRDVCYWRDASM
jgi:hypothetical protein